MKSNNRSQAKPLQKNSSLYSVPLFYPSWFWNNLVKRSIYLSAILVAVLFVSCTKSSHGFQGKNPTQYFKSFSNKVVLDWNETAFEALDAPNYLNTLTASRLTAMMHIAMHDALNSIVPVYETYALKSVNAEAHPIVAMSVAAYDVLLHHLPEKKSLLDAKLAAAIDSVASPLAKQRGIELGKQAANAILALRNNDGAFANPVAPVPPSTVPGVYQVVPPFDFVFAPFWAQMKPFGLKSPDQFRSVPQPSLTSNQYTKDFNEVKEYGSAASKKRSADQTFYAKFWYEFSEIGWNRIGRIAATDQKADLLTTARLMALLNIALADSYTAGWDSKFHYNFWRPYTAIRRAANDGNDKTIADESWEPLMTTPPVQDYPSTHSVLGNAGATVLTAFFGNTSFTMTSTSSAPAGATRTLKNFMQAADENADSRVMAGIHFRFSCKAGQEMGNKIGAWVIKNHLGLKK